MYLSYDDIMSYIYGFTYLTPFPGKNIQDYDIEHRYPCTIFC